MSWSWGLLIPKGWAGLAWLGTALAALQFSNTITVGSLLTAAVVVVLGGVFTLRNNLRAFWRDLAEERAEQIAALEAEVKERDAKIHDLQEQGRADMAAFAEEQRTIRHELKNELAAASATLIVEKAKTDLTALMELLGQQHAEAMEKIIEGLSKQDEIVRLLAGEGGTA